MNHTLTLRAFPTLPIAKGWAGVFFALLALAFALRVVGMFRIPLIPEEAYYWMYAQHPNLSYYDHPPMVAWVIGLGTALFGDNEFGVRIVGNLMMVGASVLMYAFGRMWFGRTAGLLSALLLQLLPMYFCTGFIATMDSPLVFFWMLCLLGVSFALREDRVWGWYVAGLGLGAAMLSKYTGVFLGAGALMAVIAHRPWRWHLRTVHPYLAVLLAGALFSPVVIWNAQHDWASFRFQFVDRFEGKSFSLRYVFIFVLYQILVLTPLLLVGCAWLFSRVLRIRRRLMTPRWLVTICFSAPLLSVMAYKSLRYEVHVNWTLPLFLSLFPGLCRMFLVRLRRLRTDLDRRRWARRTVWTAMICVVINVGLTAYLVMLQPRVGWISAFGPWKELAGVVEQHEDQLERESGREPLVVADGKYRLASVLAFYRSPLEEHVRAADFTTSQWVVSGRAGLGYPYWAKEVDWTGGDVIYVDDSNDVLNLGQWFERVRIVYDSKDTYPKRYRVTIAQGHRP